MGYLCEKNGLKALVPTTAQYTADETARAKGYMLSAVDVQVMAMAL